ncbi:MAG: hypothetical protein AW08_03637 [Candidatus Accumulibacter adjunctus]|uniref:Uncharacterized protein n=1 Tax=Candidatus Accumulibacter adjunctus TaxID=1454001 RepID=A0A011M4M4_9PROT|nr:MAG: hypothetical protein AW08_03637 [Candidatus Accumulibacter adjunctus]
MDVFEFREKLVGEYRQFTRSFTRIRSDDIARFVESAHDSQRSGRSGRAAVEVVRGRRMRTGACRMSIENKGG